MIRISSSVVLLKKSDLCKPENLRFIALVTSTVVFAFLFSPYLGLTATGLIFWQYTRGSVSFDASRRTAAIELQIGSPLPDLPRKPELGAIETDGDRTAEDSKHVENGLTT
jgi:hypothetical protein